MRRSLLGPLALPVLVALAGGAGCDRDGPAMGVGDAAGGRAEAARPTDAAARTAATGSDAAPAGPNPDAMDGFPAGRLRAPNGRWEARVAEGGALTVRSVNPDGAAAPDAAAVAIDTLVDPRMAWFGDTLYYARAGLWNETDLWRVTLPASTPEAVTDWPGSEDRPTLSPDGRRLAFVSGRTGIASWWVLDLATLPAKDGVQVTNVGVVRGRPGEPPAGWVPVPDGTVYAWGPTGLTWVAAGRSYTAAVPTGAQ